MQRTSSNFKILFFEIFTFRWQYRLALLGAAFLSTLFGLFTPLLQKEFVDGLIGQASLVGDKWPFSATTTLLLCFGSLLISSCFNQLVIWIGLSESIELQKLWSKRIFSLLIRKKNQFSLLDKLSQTQGRLKSSEKSQAGNILSIYTTEIPGATFVIEQSLPQAASILFPFLLVPYVLWKLYSIPLWLCFSFLLALTALQFGLAFRQSRFLTLFKVLAAQRINLAVEWIQNMRILRYLGWVPTFEKIMVQKRQEETANRLGMVTNGQVMNTVATSVNFALNLLVLFVFIFLADPSIKAQVTPGQLLSIFWLVGIFLTRPFRQLPWLILFLFDSVTALKRMADLITDVEKHNQTPEVKKPAPNFAKPPALWVQNLSLRFQDKWILKGLSFSIERGEHIALVGDIGSGKSMLLSSLMQETPASFESFFVLGLDGKSASPEELRSKFAWVPQESFILNGSLLQNLVLSPSQRVDESISQTKTIELEELLNRVTLINKNDSNEVGATPLGLQSYLGERGLNFSGGQKQRLSLARAQQFDRPFLLLDDAFSAIDEHTEQVLSEHFFKNAWRGKTVLFATQRLSLLPLFDKVLFIKNGKILGYEPFKILQASNAEFKRFLNLSQDLPKVKTQEKSPSTIQPASLISDIVASEGIPSPTLGTHPGSSEGTHD